MSQTSPHLSKALKDLEHYGLLLLADPRLPSVTTIAAGAPVSGSWWAHPRGHAIFRLARSVEAHPDVTTAKLVSGKVTFIDRRMWPALVAVAGAAEHWQMARLSPAARKLFQRVQRQGEWRSDQPVARDGPRPTRESSELEKRLLIHTRQIHTEAGSHARVLETWQGWAAEVGIRRKVPTPAEGRRDLESALALLNEHFGGRGTLPWQRARR
jgi:hypothetical protein